ncbi:hypothetical protein V5O48_006113 [Marasmius crinis-equi]|uniref:Uncharacterized protein n=1 Tax=Marasmius crinis-equi TaxID=585013 RepID=A0ABR3FL10_9AGAR
MSDSESESVEVARLLSETPKTQAEAPRLSLKSSPCHYPFLTQASDQEMVKAFLEAENAPVPVYIEMNPLDSQVTQDPIDQAYDEFTYAIGRHLDLFYYRKALSQPLEDYAEEIYDGWTAIFPDPLRLSFVKERAGDDKEEAAKILKEALLTDSSLACSRYRGKVNDRQEEEGFWKPVHVRSGLVTFESLVNHTVRFDNFARWSSQAYVQEVEKLKEHKAKLSAAQKTLYSYPFLDNPGFTFAVASDNLQIANAAASEAFGEFLRKRIVVHVA